MVMARALRPCARTDFVRAVDFLAEITLSTYHLIALSPYHPTTLSSFHPFTLSSPYHPITLSPYHPHLRVGAPALALHMAPARAVAPPRAAQYPLARLVGRYREI